jgi:hypothetical protein
MNPPPPPVRESKNRPGLAPSSAKCSKHEARTYRHDGLDSSMTVIISFCWPPDAAAAGAARRASSSSRSLLGWLFMVTLVVSVAGVSVVAVAAACFFFLSSSVMLGTCSGGID